MKFLKNCLIAAGITALFFSCSKTDTHLPASTGTLSSNDTTGDCLPLIVKGTYTAGVALNETNYIDVYVNTTSIGAFNIYTDSINGMSFASSGLESLGTTGSNRIRLYSHGKPITSGLTTFNVIYNGSHCTVSIIVGGVASGSYLVSDTPNLAASAAASGAYTTGIALNAGDTVEMRIKVTRPGSIFINTNTLNGISFSGTGIYTTPGVYIITLLGTGVPQNPGTLTFYALDSLSDTSSFKVTIQPYGGASAAKFTLTGAPNSCAGFSSYGTYTAGVKMQAGDSVTTFIDVTKGGLYSIVTSSVNGVVFSATGQVDSGQHLITLHASGLPVSPGTYYYSPTGDSSSCSFGINFAQGAGIYILGGAPGACTIPNPSNAKYKTDSALTANSTISIPVTVTTVGSYSITTPTVNGMTFTGAGNFVNPGPNSIVLTGTGVPVSPGITNFVVPSRTGNCGFTINVIPGTAEFTLQEEAYGQCSGSTLSGKYVAGTALSASNTATLKVNVTYPGPYELVSDSADGIIFSKKGIFTTTGIQTVTLNGSGKPKAVGSYILTVTGGMDIYGTGSNCTIGVVVTANNGTADYTLGGAPNSCTAPAVSGTYQSGTALVAGDSAVLGVTVTSIGTYSITTTTVNGISFKGSGSFKTTGAQTVTLAGTGTPTAAGTNSLKVTGGTSSCSFPITATVGTTPPPSGILNGVVNGASSATDFTTYASANYSTAAGYILEVGGSDANGDSLYFNVQASSAITQGSTYNQGTTTAGLVSAYYITGPTTYVAATSAITPGGSLLTITITKKTATEVAGTFTATLKDNSGAGPNSTTIATGKFDLPL